ncbi:BnaC05g30090D [Brassica napus]|uniref:BnaC05g30090D protein n=1 Tax=Brassica napus TaxID=3708 RepID=A0A078HKX1_BRANA|nr:BnaC05g30090D [Brassica napus]
MMFALLASIVQIYNYKYDDKLFTPAPQFESQNSKLPKQNTSIMFFTLHSLVVKKDEDVKVLAMVGDEDWLPPPAKVIFTKIISIISKSPLKISAITSLKNAYNGHEEAVPLYFYFPSNI